MIIELITKEDPLFCRCETPTEFRGAQIMTCLVCTRRPRPPFAAMVGPSARVLAYSNCSISQEPAWSSILAQFAAKTDDVLMRFCRLMHIGVVSSPMLSAAATLLRPNDFSTVNPSSIEAEGICRCGIESPSVGADDDRRSCRRVRPGMSLYRGDVKSLLLLDICPNRMAKTCHATIIDRRLAIYCLVSGHGWTDGYTSVTRL
jgi:hypothetical protein